MAQPLVGAHRPVLLEASIAALRVRVDGVYVDGTFGRGGHSRAILEKLGPRGRLIAVDRDPEAVAVAQAWARQESRLTVVPANYAQLQDKLAELGLLGRVDGVLLDLGVSSPQLDDPERGFSFQHDGPLDMRMNPLAGESAAQWLARADEADIRQVLWDFGEENKGRRIAAAIVARRAEGPLLRTGQLAELIERAVGGRRGARIHPATRSFQAIRMQVNGELAGLRAVLPQIVAALAPGGRLAVISFHSLEDRIVKRYLRALARPLAPDPVSPIPPSTLLDLARVLPDSAEQAANPRARSAVLRCATKAAL